MSELKKVICGNWKKGVSHIGEGIRKGALWMEDYTDESK